MNNVYTNMDAASAVSYYVDRKEKEEAAYEKRCDQAQEKAAEHTEAFEEIMIAHFMAVDPKIDVSEVGMVLYQTLYNHFLKEV